MVKLFVPRALIALGVGVTTAFLFIAINPDRPHLAKLRHFKILLRADPPRAQWIKDNELAEFAKAHDVEFDVVTARSFEEVLSAMQAEKDKPTRMLLASIDAEIAEELRRQAAVRPM